MDEKRKKEYLKQKKEIEKMTLSVMGFDKYDVISLTKEEFLEKLPLIEMALTTSMLNDMTQGLGSLRI